MKTVRISTPGFFYIGSLVLLPLLMLAIFSHEYRVYDYYFNPDSLYLPSLYQGLFVDGYPLKSFYLNPSILLVPDVILYFPLMALTGDVILSSFIFSILQHLLIFGFTLMIFRLLFRKHALQAGALANILFLVLFLGAVLSKEILFAAFSLVSTNHVGVFVMMLLSLWLFLRHQIKPGTVKAVLLALLVFLSVFSDLLYVLMFPVPLMAVVVLRGIVTRSWQGLKIVALVFVAAIFGYFVQGYVDGEFLYLARLPEVSIMSNIVPAFHLMMADLWHFASALDAHTLLIMLSFISFIAHVAVVVKMIKKRDLNSPVSFYLAFSAIYMMIIFWMPVLTGSYIAKHILRYNISAFYLAMINIPVLMVYALSGKQVQIKKLFTWLFSLGFIMMFTVGTANLSKNGIRNFFDYYPDFVRELDEIAEKEQLKNGVANFWNAKPITLFSKKGLCVYHSWDNLYPYFHVVGRYYFTGRNEEFNFAVISSFNDKEAYTQYLGKAGKVIKNGGTEVVVLPVFRYDQETGQPHFVAEKEPPERLQ